MAAALLPAQYYLVKEWQPVLLNHKAHTRARKRAIIAFARQLLLDLWRRQTGRRTPEQLGWVMTEARFDGALRPAPSEKIGSASLPPRLHIARMETSRKIALVTGAGSGIGRETAKALLIAGYAVVLAGRRAEALAATAAESGAPVDQFLVVPTDITQPAAVKHLFARAREVFGRLDVLFNNAGVGAPGLPLEDFPFERWQEVIATNLTGPYLCTQEAFRLMKSQRPQGGRIINNGSISAHVPRLHSAPYTAAKHAVTGLTKSTALDGRPFGIACGQIDIGNADTAMAGNMKKGVPQADGSIAVEPVMDVKCVVQAVLYMAGLPLDANVPNITVIATRMPYIGRG